MDKITHMAFLNEFTKIASEQSDDFKRKLLEGGIGAGLASFLLAPISTISDKKSVLPALKHKSSAEIAKVIWREGTNTLPKGASKLHKLVAGLKSFYAGQGLKTMKLIPQMALTMALGMLAGHIISPKKPVVRLTNPEIKKLKTILKNDNK